MKSMSRALFVLVATALVGTGFSNQAEATTIDIANVVTTATTLDADIVVNALNEPTGGYAFQVAFNLADLTPDGLGYVNDPNSKLGDLTDPILDLSLAAPGLLDLYVISIKSNAALTALQGTFPASFVLAHVMFSRASPTAGTDLQLLNVALSTVDGEGTIPLGNTVPEPASVLLVGTGFATLVARRRRQNKAQL